MNQIILRSAACAVSVLILAPAAHAVPRVMLDQSVLIHIPAKDVTEFKSFIGKALNEGPADMVTEWSSSARPGKPAVKVLLTPGARITTQSAGQCRLLSAQVSQSRHAESWKVWFCQQADGHWKISGLQ